ncbi:hypothetical protein CBR_g29494 [Chara braunii]|uniref:Uncharacterized protein n=1 Tax=Chara braunii TaxID=69332 RepID=A0A388LAP1_CHABU|nr:hypothetical protein CBR_g29494 [Chara braunii]|eukprot:GBG79344.1 hypothetical protein CBR_g29494 [Chara braunii]
MAARIRDGGSYGGTNRNDSGGILQAPAQGASTSSAIVPYQGPQSRNDGGSGYNNGSYNSGSNSYNRGYDNNQRYNRQWTGGYRDREQERDDKVNRMYDLLSEQMEKREQCKREIENQKRLEEEKNKLKDEEEKRAQAIKDREQHEARLGKIVRTSVKAVCESALGRKVDIPEDDEDEVSKLRRELGELRSKNQGETSEQRLEALRKEKDALLKIKEQEGEEERL